MGQAHKRAACGHEKLAPRVPYRHCTRCHASLADHVTKRGPADDFQVVTVFAPGKHPEFRRRRAKLPDPRRLTFSHQRHMTEGLRLVAGADAFTLDRLLSHIDPGPQEESEEFVRRIYEQRHIDLSSDRNGKARR